jgi:hypothetical protein
MDFFFRGSHERTLGYCSLLAGSFKVAVFSKCLFHNNTN